MTQLLKLNKNSFNDFYQTMHNKLSIEIINELAIKAMAVVVLNENKLLRNQDELRTIVESTEREYAEVFLQNSHDILSNHLSPTMMNLLADLSENQQKGLLTKENKQDWLHHLFNLQLGGKSDLFAFEESVYALCNQLFSSVEGDVYLTSGNATYHSLMLSEQQSVAAESIKSTNIPALLNLILGNIQYKVSDPILNPAYMQNGKLMPFKKGFLAEPWGMKISLNEDAKQRFSVVSNNYQNYAIQHLWQQVSDFAIVAVPMNHLFSTVKSEIEMRKWLLEQGHLKSIVAFPSGGFIKSTNIGFSLLIFDFTKIYDEVNLVSLKDSDFVERQLRENKLTQIDTLVEIINGKSNKISQRIAIETLAKNDYVLDPERYIVDSQTEAALEILNQYETATLGSFVEVLRPAPSLSKEEGKYSIFEIQGGDLPEYGYIDSISKTNQVEESQLKGLEKYYLKENDILITIRGVTGKVGIVSKSLLEQYEGRVIAGKICVVLRLQNAEKITPLALLMQLRSEFCQSRLQLLSSGAMIAGLSVKALKEFPIALFSLQKQQELAENFHQQAKIKQMIRQQEQEMKQLANNFWQTN